MEKLMVEHPILVYHHILITAARSVIAAFDTFPLLFYLVHSFRSFLIYFGCTDVVY